MALAPTQPEWTLATAPAKTRAKDTGNSGIKLKIPLTATGSTAPEANLETATDVASGAEIRVAARPWATRVKVEAGPWGTRAKSQLSSTAEAAPPT
jgi:hypothetical protein